MTEVDLVRPSGGKYGLGDRVRARREITGGAVVAAIRDRDLEVEFTPPQASPRQWLVEGGKVWLGWYWERVDLEAYLVDPRVVALSLGEQLIQTAGYTQALERAADSIAVYTAARTALSLSRRRFQPLANRWGPQGGRFRHSVPEERQATACRTQVQAILQRQSEDLSVREEEVLSRFDALTIECSSGGCRHENFLTYFSAKELLSAMSRELPALGLEGPYAFREAVISAIERAPEVWRWLPEWSRLRDQVREIQTNDGPSSR